jgi:hypothetical protein
MRSVATILVLPGEEIQTRKSIVKLHIRVLLVPHHVLKMLCPKQTLQRKMHVKNVPCLSQAALRRGRDERAGRTEAGPKRVAGVRARVVRARVVRVRGVRLDMFTYPVSYYKKYITVHSIVSSTYTRLEKKRRFVVFGAFDVHVRTRIL